jgi:2-polyprenyl-3-methyl-5-hydroxy-6-metoxy-1,4-benzoquinol methylase
MDVGVQEVSGPDLAPQPSESRWKAARRILGPLTISERLLLLFCHEPSDHFVGGGYGETSEEWEGVDSLYMWRLAIPNFDDLARGKTVLDYGCGNGYQIEALAKLGASHVHGVDLAAGKIEHAERRLSGLANASADTEIGGRQFDVVLSLNAFEHFPEPEKNLAEMVSALKPGGKIMLTFGPPWFAPYGPHMYFMTLLPWLPFWFSEKTVHRVRRLFRDDGSTTYGPGLNGMTVARFQRVVADAGLEAEFLNFQAMFGQRWLTKVPLLRELFVNQREAVLRKPSC